MLPWSYKSASHKYWWEWIIPCVADLQSISHNFSTLQPQRTNRWTTFFPLPYIWMKQLWGRSQFFQSYHAHTATDCLLRNFYIGNLPDESYSMPQEKESDPYHAFSALPYIFPFLSLTFFQPTRWTPHPRRTKSTTTNWKNWQIKLWRKETKHLKHSSTDLPPNSNSQSKDIIWVEIIP